MIIDLLVIRDTSLVGTIGELIARKYLHSEHIAAFKFRSDSEFLNSFLNKKQIKYLKDLTEHGPNWSWDFVGIRHVSKENYLIEVKTSRLGKRKRGLKGNQSRRSRQGWTKEDIEGAKR